MAIPPVPGKKLSGKSGAPKRTPQHSASAKKKAASASAKKKPVARKVEVDPSPKATKKPQRVAAAKKAQPAARRRPVEQAPASETPIPVVAGKTKKLQKKEHAHKGLHRLLVGVNIFLIMCVVSAGAGYAYLKFRLGQLDKIAFSCQVLRNCGNDDPGRPMNVLMVGSDTRENISEKERAQFGNAEDVGGERTDTMMVLHVDPRAEKASILSIPRDLWVPIAGLGYNERINTASGIRTKAGRTSTTRRTSVTNALGATVTQPSAPIKDGPERLIATIRQSLGIEIDHYIQVDFNGFRSIVSAVGGVTVPFPAPARDKLAGLDIKQAGCINISGDQALAYVRSRHFQYFESGRWRSDPTGDIGRIQRQQDFIRRMLRQAISKGIRNPIKLNSLISAGIGNVKIDDALSNKDILSLGKRFKSLEPEAVDMLTLPTEGFKTSGGASVLRLKPAETREIVDRFNGVAPPETTGGVVPNISPTTVRVLVLNGTGVNGQAGQVQRSLTAVGFGSGGVGDAPGGFGKSSTEIRYGAGQLQKAQLLQAYMVNGAKLVLDSTLKGGDLQLIVGSGYGGVKPSIKPGVGTATTVAPATTTTVKGAIPTPKGAAALSC
ncbi:MAG: LCP family protein [Acidimicrobiales bacterium]|nr:LCP family protein [Acidimicrobiales bacterium]